MPPTIVIQKLKVPWYKRSLDFSSVSDTDILLFTKHLSVGLKVGLTIVDGLEILASQAKGSMKKIMDYILETVKTGQPLYKALQHYPKYFSPIYINLVRTGEYAGTLESNLHGLAENLRKVHDMKRKVKSAMMYPTMVFIAVMGLGFSVALFVLPKILPLFRTIDVELPVTTKGLLFIADLFDKHGILISIVTFVFIGAFWWLLRQKFIKPFTHRLILHIPIVSKIVINTNMVRFTRTLGILLSSGVTVDTSLQITVDSTDNFVYRKAIMSLIAQVQKGQPLANALSYYPEIFPVLTTRMISMGEQTASLDKTLSYLAEFYEEEVDNTMKNLTTVLEPVMLMVVGVIVGLVAVSILGPIYQITGSLRK